MLSQPDEASTNDTDEKMENKAIDSEMKNNNDAHTDISYCDKFELFNALQFYSGKLFIDIRSKLEWKKQKIIQFVNIPSGILDDNDCDKQLITQFMTEKKTDHITDIYCVANQSIIDQKIAFKFCNRFQAVIRKQFEQNIPICIMKSSFETFNKAFSYLCYKQYYQLIEEYPSQIIDDELFLGNISDAQNEETLTELDITHIVNMTPTTKCQKFNGKKKNCDLKIEYLHCPIYDSEEDNIQQYFEKGITFIQQTLEQNKNGNIRNRILIHCVAGVSRSSSMVIAYLMKTEKISFEKAYKYTLKRRECILPNDGFVKQLKLYEKNGFVVK